MKLQTSHKSCLSLLKNFLQKGMGDLCRKFTLIFWIVIFELHANFFLVNKNGNLNSLIACIWLSFVFRFRIVKDRIKGEYVPDFPWLDIALDLNKMPWYSYFFNATIFTVTKIWKKTYKRQTVYARLVGE